MPAPWVGLARVRTTAPFPSRTRTVTSVAWFTRNEIVVWFRPAAVITAGLSASPLTRGELTARGGVGAGVGAGLGPGSGPPIPFMLLDLLTMFRHAEMEAWSCRISGGAPGGVELNKVPKSAPLFSR